MTMNNPFPTIELIHLLYFAYGAAFLFLSFSIGTKNMKGSNLRIADSLWLLAMFGLAHGVFQIMETYPLIEGEHLTLDQLYYYEVYSNVLLIVSFMFLLQFGLSLSFENKSKRVIWTMGTYAALCINLVLFIELHGHSSNMLIMQQIENGARNTFGFSGGLAAAYGTITYSYSREMKNLHDSISRNIFYAGTVIAVYAFSITSVFSDFARSLNVPPELLWAGAAVLIAYFIVKALNVFDIETRLRVEKQARILVQTEKLASLGQLAAGIAHEINNPLANASLGIQMLRNKLGSNTEQATSERIDAVEKNINRAAVIAYELLLFTREREAEFLSLNINEVITDALTQMKHKLRSVVIERDLAQLPDIMGDRGKLEQVFINILSNALESMPEGGRISISTVLREGMVEASVADTGTGIASENLSRVFEPFFTTKEIGLGTGLGLSISYGIIKQHQGSINISSIVGQGTTVTVKIPVRE
jgi:two-component system NtrC family sensor kinase